MDQKCDGISKQEKKNKESSILFSLCECNPTKWFFSSSEFKTYARNIDTKPWTYRAYWAVLRHRESFSTEGFAFACISTKKKKGHLLSYLSKTFSKTFSMMNDVTCIVYCADMDASTLFIRVCCMCALRPLSSLTTSAQKETDTKDTATIHKHTMPRRHADSTQDENPRKRRQLSADEVFVEAARNGDTTAVRAVLDKYFTVRKTMAFGAAHEACRGNHDECLTLLLPYVETTQMGFGMLLSECVHADHVACTEVLLQHWKSVCDDVALVPHDAKHSAGQPASLCPAMWSDPAVCRVLIDAGADLHTKNESEQLPLHYACESGALDVVKMLVEAGVGVRATDDEGSTCLAIAAYSGNTETARYLVGLPHVDVNHRDSTDFTVLHSAAASKATDVAQVLIDAGADIDAMNNEGHAPLYFACASGALDVVKMLVRAGADDRGGTCLTKAANCGHTEVVRYLLCLPEVELNRRDDDLKTALHSAVEHAHTDVVQVLIDAGADTNTPIIVDYSLNLSPLQAACIMETLDIVKMLVRAGAGVRATDTNGSTCLHFAAKFGRTETVRYLVGLPEVELNHRDTAKNYTALQYAVQYNHTDVEQVLLDAL